MTANIRHCKLYQVEIAQLSRWKAAGKRQSCPCPLDEPENMPSWWEKMVERGEFQKGVPIGIQVAADRANALLGDDDDQPESNPGLSAFLDSIHRGDVTLDYSSGLAIARQNVLVLNFLLNDAITKNNIKEVSKLRKELTDAGDALRALEKDRAKIQAEADQTLKKSDVAVAWTELCQNIPKRFRQGLRAAFGELEEHAVSAEAWNEFADNLVDRICAGMRESGYAAD